MLLELGAWIETQTTLIVGTNLFLGYAGQDASNIAVLNILQDNTGSALYPLLPDRNDRIITHVARHKDWRTAMEMAYVIYNVIHANRANIDFPIIGSMPQLNCQYMNAMTTPQYAGEDEKNRHIFTCDYMFKIKDKV